MSPTRVVNYVNVCSLIRCELGECDCLICVVVSVGSDEHGFVTYGRLNSTVL